MVVALHGDDRTKGKTKQGALKAKAANSKAEKKGFYVTTAIDYVNAPPHIGHSLEKVQADVLARWHRLKGIPVFFVTGTDEHGAKVERSARELGMEPKQWTDKIAAEFRDAWQKLGLDFDRFIRTTDADHEKKVRQFMQLLFDRGFIYKGKYEGLYCVGCEAFYTEKELADGNCPVHQKRCEQFSEETYFFRLSAFEKKLIELYSAPGLVLPDHRRVEVLNRLKGGLKDLSVTRTNVKWGVQFPADTKHTIYVWFDALLNYITALGWPDDKKLKQFWPADWHLIGKDILWFHTAVWDAMLLAAGLQLPKVFVHGYLTIEGQKISKSLGNVIDPREMAARYGADTLRYYLLREIPSTEDGDVSERAIIARHNSELADQLGNLVNRALVLCEKFCGGKVPAKGKSEEEADVHLQDCALEALPKMENALAELKFHDALAELWRLVAKANAYVNDTKPWELKGGRQSTVLYNLLEGIRFIAVLLQPFLPRTGVIILEQLGLEPAKQDFSTLKSFGLLKAGTKLKRGEILFKKIETGGERMKAEVKKETEGKTEVAFGEFEKLDLRVAEIKQAEEVKGSDKLVKLQIDIGGETKQIVAGIRKNYPPSGLIGRQIIIVNNLKPREYKQFGLTSHAMLLAAESEAGPVLLTTDKKVKPGAPVG